MQAVDLTTTTAVVVASASSGITTTTTTLLSPTCIELKTDTLVKTWNPEIFELPFAVVNPHKAREFAQYNSLAAKGYRDHTITIMMKKENGALGFFVQPVFLFFEKDVQSTNLIFVCCRNPATNPSNFQSFFSSF